LPGAARLYIGTTRCWRNRSHPPGWDWLLLTNNTSFGVAQRNKLVRKGSYPICFVMTATPIPRTLGLTLYGDLDIRSSGKARRGRGVSKLFCARRKACPGYGRSCGKTRPGPPGLRDLSRVEDADTQRRSQGRHQGMASLEKCLCAV